VEEAVKQQPNIARNLKTLSIDPFRDLQFVVLVKSESSDDPLLLVQGGFDPAPFKTGDGLKQLEVSDGSASYSVYEVNVGLFQPPYFAVRVNDHLVALAHDRTAVVNVLKRRDGRKKDEKPGPLVEAARSLESQQVMSFVGLGGPLAKQDWGTQLPETQKIVAGSTFRGHVWLQPDLVVELAVRPAKAEQVEPMKDTVEGFRLLLINYLGKVPQPFLPVVLLKALLKECTVSAEGREVVSKGHLTLEKLDELFKEKP
jgi:hypothetical protein